MSCVKWRKSSRRLRQLSLTASSAWRDKKRNIFAFQSQSVKTRLSNDMFPRLFLMHVLYIHLYLKPVSLLCLDYDLSVLLANNVRKCLAIPEATGWTHFRQGTHQTGGYRCMGCIKPIKEKIPFGLSTGENDNESEKNGRLQTIAWSSQQRKHLAHNSGEKTRTTS